LLKKPHGEALKDLIDSYDIERAAGPSPSSLLYRFRREALAVKWSGRRQGFVDTSSVSVNPSRGEA
jgi:hypothetical protein